MGDSLININKMAINYLPKCKNQRKVSFLNEALPNVYKHLLLQGNILGPGTYN